MKTAYDTVLESWEQGHGIPDLKQGILEEVRECIDPKTEPALADALNSAIKEAPVA